MDVTKWAGTSLTLSTRIREVLCSNPCRDAGYPTWGVSWLSSVPTAKYRDSVDLCHNRFLLHAMQFIAHPQSYHSMLYSVAT
jgi:hypothetical protein